MSTTFDDYSYETDFDDLDEYETEALRNLIQRWTSEQLRPVHSILADYYNIQVKDSIIREALSSDLSLAYEVSAGSSRDTCVRDLLIDTVLNVMELNEWPMYGSSDEYKTQFYQSLSDKALTGDITILD